MKDRSISQFRSVLVLSATAALIALASFSFISAPAAAGSADLTVYGWITDSIGDPVDGADVMVEVMAGAHPQATYTTGSDGYYQVDFDSTVWQVGNTVQTTATYGGVPESNTGVADDSTILLINVQFSTEIPEFGSLTGVLVTMGIVGVIATVSMRRKKA